MKNPLAVQEFIDFLFANNQKVVSKATAKETDQSQTIYFKMEKVVNGGVSQITINRDDIHETITTNFATMQEDFLIVETNSNVLTTASSAWDRIVEGVSNVLAANS